MSWTNFPWAVSTFTCNIIKTMHCLHRERTKNKQKQTNKQQIVGKQLVRSDEPTTMNG